jgi:hypothetical protein
MKVCAERSKLQIMGYTKEWVIQKNGLFIIIITTISVVINQHHHQKTNLKAGCQQ